MSSCSPCRPVTAHIKKALQHAFALPEWICVSEVGNATGALCCRHADMILFNTYPSHRLSLVGIEIKASLSDLDRELAHPDKAEEIASYCNEWFLAVPKGLLPEGKMIPEGWGILEVNPRGTVRILRPSLWREDVPLPRSFWASLLRRQAMALSEERKSLFLAGQQEGVASYEKQLTDAKAELSFLRIARSSHYQKAFKRLYQAFKEEPDVGLSLSSITEEDARFMVWALKNRFVLTDSMVSMNQTMHDFYRDLEQLSERLAFLKNK